MRISESMLRALGSFYTIDVTYRPSMLGNHSRMAIQPVLNLGPLTLPAGRKDYFMSNQGDLNRSWAARYLNDETEVDRLTTGFAGLVLSGQGASSEASSLANRLSNLLGEPVVSAIRKTAVRNAYRNACITEARRAGTELAREIKGHIPHDAEYAVRDGRIRHCPGY